MRHVSRTAVAGALFVAALGTAAILELAPRRTQHVDPGANPRTTPHPAEILPSTTWDTLVVRQAGLETTIRRQGGRFIVTAPVSSPADEAAAAAAFAAIEGLELIAPITDRPARHAELEVDAEGGVKVTSRLGNRPLLELVVGKVIQDGTMVRIGSGPVVWRAAGDLRAIFARSPTQWRDRMVAHFAPRDAERIEIAGRGGAHIVLSRPPGTDDGWHVVTSSVSIQKLDPQVPRQLLAAMSSLEASGFADDARSDAAGLDVPAFTIGVGLSGGRTITVRVGDARGSHEVFVAVPGRAQVFLVKQFEVDRIARHPIQFRDKTLCDISDAEVIAFGVARGPASFAVERRDANWHAVRPKGLNVDSEKVASLASVFRQWSAPRIAENAPAGAIGVPRAVIFARSARGSCSIRVGRDLDDGSGTFVRVSSSPDLFIVPPWMIDRIAVAPATLARDAPAG